MNLKDRLERIEKKINEVEITTGRVFYVMNSTDTGYEEFVREHGEYPDGVAKVYTSLSDAYNAMVSNRNDVCYIASHGGHAQTAILSIAKNRCHFRSFDVQRGRSYGSRSRVTMGVTTSASDIAVVKNTGVGNTFKGLKFDSSNTKDESLYAFAEGGEYSFFEDCEFYKSTDLDEDAAAELLMNGDSCKFKNCTFGSLANAVTATGARPCVLLTRETITGKVCRDGMFEDCLFWRKSNGATANCFVYSSGATDVERQLLFKRCGFINAKLSTYTPAQAVKGAATFTEGNIILDPGCYAVGCTKVSTTNGVIVTGPAVNSGAGIAVNAA